VIGEELRAEIRAASFRIGPADHDKFFAMEAFDLAPQAAIAGRVGRTGALRDNALDTQPGLTPAVFTNPNEEDSMPKYFGALTIVLSLGMVLTRVFLLKRQGIKAMKFGAIDKTDFLIPPFALFYFYVLFAAAFGWPGVGKRQFFHFGAVAWAGVLFCLAGLVLLLWSLISFRQSFRIGIDTDHPDMLIVDGVFAFSRNPIYVAFAVVLIGEFLIFPNWISLIYLGVATWLFHRQVLREEEYLKKHYGRAYAEYCHRVRRYF
jgi:protein-S-isoprenylcysteine O-methyltransferase Ste14